MLAIAAMSRNRVIGNGSSIPWRIPDELKWFRRMTLGCVVVMGRRTFESLAKPLDGRVTVVLTRHPRRLLKDEKLRERFGEAVVRSSAYRSGDVTQLHLPRMPLAQVRLARGIESLARPDVKTWLCGGAQVYEQFLGRCTELYLSIVNREVEGDAYFPRFEHLFDLAGVIEEFPEFCVYRYVRNSVVATASPKASRRRESAKPRIAARSGRSSVADSKHASAIGTMPGLETASDGPGCQPGRKRSSSSRDRS